MRCSGMGASLSTTMLFVSRFTVTFTTPSTLRTAFSTWALHAEHVMPVTSYFVLTIVSLLGYTP